MVRLSHGCCAVSFPRELDARALGCAGCYNHSMSMFRHRSRQPLYGQPIVQMQMAGAHRWFRTSVLVRPIARGVPRVYLSVSGYGFLTEDEVRKLAQALLDAIEQSKALTARESG
jgi:hypothetical protein